MIRTGTGWTWFAMQPEGQVCGRPLDKVSVIYRPRDFSGGPVVKNPPSNAGNTGLIPGQGTAIPHAGGK